MQVVLPAREIVDNLRICSEPPLTFGHNQHMLDPRDGLTLFGPVDHGKPHGIRWAVIGTKSGIRRMKRWVSSVNQPILRGNGVARPNYPGFDAAFRCVWSPAPVVECEVPDKKLQRVANITDRYQRVYKTVDMFSKRIAESLRTEDAGIDIWFVVIPQYVYKNCRPRSTIASSDRVLPETTLTLKEALRVPEQPFLFDDLNDLAIQYTFQPNFHHQLKARLLNLQIPIQIVRERTIAYREFLNRAGDPIEDLLVQEPDIAWHLSTAAFYKAGGRPWKLGAAREGVCYLGIAFRKLENSPESKVACCAAQMFLDSGDGIVFRGADGPWYGGVPGNYHLDRPSAAELVKRAVDGYADRNGGKYPSEVFVHGKVKFSDEEWLGFVEGAGPETNVVGVHVRVSGIGFKLFRKGTRPILRGITHYLNHRQALLWTQGFVPRLRTYPGREVPNPILVEVCRGDADIEVVTSDILALTKLNYNSCRYGDRAPVTLKFADAVGEILTAAPVDFVKDTPLPFKYYI